jgi:hypothetical protein
VIGAEKPQVKTRVAALPPDFTSERLLRYGRSLSPICRFRPDNRLYMRDWKRHFDHYKIREVTFCSISTSLADLSSQNPFSNTHLTICEMCVIQLSHQERFEQAALYVWFWIIQYTRGIVSKPAEIPRERHFRLLPYLTRCSSSAFA